MKAVPITTGQAGRILCLSGAGVRALEARYGLPVLRTSGGHRRYDRRIILGLAEARDEGLSGTGAVHRAIELAASGRYDEPAVLRERMAHLERRMRGVQDMMEEVVARLDRVLMDSNA